MPSPTVFPPAAAARSTTPRLYLGAQPGGALGGALDEVEYHDRAISAKDIAAIYFAGRQGKCRAEDL